MKKGDGGGADVLESIATLGLEGLVKEYEEVKAETEAPPGLTMDAFGKNKERNRYPDIGCWDETRVVLGEGVQTEDGETVSYVHASFVDGSRRPKEFIATQAPMDGTVEEFWHMVWEQRVATILMLCLCKESGRRKCEQYWKVERGATHRTESGYAITTVRRSTDTIGGHVFVTTHLEMVKGGEEGKKRKLAHLLHANWPDRGLPPQPAAGALLFLSRALDELNSKLAAANGFPPTLPPPPKLVHCSAGIGRTGAFIALDYAFDALQRRLPLRLKALLRQLRRQRKHSVQNSHQYVFIHLTLAEHIISLDSAAAAPFPKLDLAPLRAYPQTHPITN